MQYTANKKKGSGWVKYKWEQMEDVVNGKYEDLIARGLGSTTCAEA